MKRTSFFQDNSDGDVSKEVLIDFFLSWTLRCSIDENQLDISEKVQKYSKCILHFFLKEKLGDIAIDNYKVLEVETVKQWKQIDLLCALKLELKGKEIKWFVLTFENKMYTKLHGNQLERYKNAIYERYSDESIEKLFIYLTNQMEIPPEDDIQCKNNGYRALSLWEIAEHLKNDHPDHSGNALFDEFWYNYI